MVFINLKKQLCSHRFIKAIVAIAKQEKDGKLFFKNRKSFENKSPIYFSVRFPSMSAKISDMSSQLATSGVGIEHREREPFTERLSFTWTHNSSWFANNLLFKQCTCDARTYDICLYLLCIAKYNKWWRHKVCECTCTKTLVLKSYQNILVHCDQLNLYPMLI